MAEGLPQTGSPTTVLLIEDEVQMRRFLRSALESHNVRLVEAGTAREGMAHAAGYRPDLILLDLGLPDGDGIDMTRRLREWSRTPIIVISARGQEDDKVRALDAGADDYLTKPFGIGELLARMRVALRHAADRPGEPSPVFAVGDLRMDLVKRQVTVAGAPVHLTPTEYKLLATLVRNAGKVLTHSYLLKEVWGLHTKDQSHYLRVYMGQLRHKLEADPARPSLLLTEPGVGYRLRDE
jgi:two-component system, OmpR family, KDP operon response regulator KdpE